MTPANTILTMPTRISLSAGPIRRSWNQLARTGEFVSNRYGKFAITKDDLAQMLRNFREVTPKAPTELPIDFDHLSMDPKKPGDGMAAGWMKQLELREDGEELWGDIEWTPSAAEKIEHQEYRFVSPSFVKNHVHKDGKKIGTTLLAAAITNHPFLEGMQALSLYNCSLMPLFDFSKPETRLVSAHEALNLNSPEGTQPGQRVMIAPGNARTQDEIGATFEIAEVVGQGDDSFVSVKDANGMVHKWFRATELLPASATPANPQHPGLAPGASPTVPVQAGIAGLGGTTPGVPNTGAVVNTADPNTPPLDPAAAPPGVPNPLLAAAGAKVAGAEPTLAAPSIAGAVGTTPGDVPGGAAAGAEPGEGEEPAEGEEPEGEEPAEGEEEAPAEGEEQAEGDGMPDGLKARNVSDRADETVETATETSTKAANTAEKATKVAKIADRVASAAETTPSWLAALELPDELKKAIGAALAAQPRAQQPQKGMHMKFMLSNNKGEPVEVTEEQLAAAGVTIVPDGSVAVPAKELAGMKAQVHNLSSRLDESEKARVKVEFDGELARLKAKALITGPQEQFARKTWGGSLDLSAFYAWAETFTTPVLALNTEHGSGGKAETKKTNGEQASEQLISLSQKIAREEGVPMRDAMIKASAQLPEAAEAYREQFAL